MQENYKYNTAQTIHVGTAELTALPAQVYMCYTRVLNCAYFSSFNFKYMYLEGIEFLFYAYYYYCTYQVESKVLSLCLERQADSL